MNAEWLLQHFDRLSESPDAIPRLRRFIQDLAIRGKLVDQDPKEEPEAELLSLIQAGVAARTSPVGWIGGSLGSFLDMQYGKGLAASDRKEEGDVPAV
jgi:type I restriction enzyme S subunit